VLTHDPVVVKATITINDRSFTGISAANPTKSIEKQSPYEVAETSAVGRALGFAGFGVVESIASADEMVKAQQGHKRDIASYESGQYCQKCNADALLLRTSRTGANLGKSYYYCAAHNGFSHWAAGVPTAQQG
jgi:hypothetical protein